jgi:hypothetical protein
MEGHKTPGKKEEVKHEETKSSAFKNKGKIAPKKDFIQGLI